MLPFEAHRSCPKCGNKDNKDETGRVWAALDLHWCPGAVFDCVILGEHLHLRCLKCGFQALSECADTP